MRSRTWLVALLAASFLGLQAQALAKPAGQPAAKPGSGAAAKPVAAPAEQPGPAARTEPAPAGTKPAAAGAITGLQMQQAGDALVEPVGATPELQGDQQFTNTINWTKRVITVLGIGIAPDRGTLATRRTLAKSYALEDGLRQLSEAVDKVRVNADAYVRDLTVADDDVRSKVHRTIRAAKIMDTNILPDGSVELKLQMKLYDKDGLAGALLPDERSPIVLAAGNGLSLPATQWTGIILDARGTGAQPALAPSIRSTEGQALADRPSVAFVHTRGGAGELAGEKPLSFKVKRAAGMTKADLLLETADFAKLKDALSKGGLSVVIMI